MKRTALIRRASKVRKSRKPRSRCAWVAPGRTSGRCSRSPYRKDVPWCGTHLVQKIDEAARMRVFMRDAGICQRCGGPGRDWSHWPSRSYRGTRWLLDGAVVHCSSCHKWLTDRPLEHEAWVRSHFGDDTVTELRQIALEFASGRAKIDLVETALRLGVFASLAKEEAA